MLVKSSRVSLWGSNQQQISKCLLCNLPEFGIPPWLLFWSLNHTQFEISDHKVTKVLIHFLFPIQCSIQPIFAHFCCCSKVGSSEGSNSPGPRLTLFADNWEWGTRLQRGAGILEQAGQKCPDYYSSQQSGHSVACYFVSWCRSYKPIMKIPSTLPVVVFCKPPPTVRSH